MSLENGLIVFLPTSSRASVALPWWSVRDGAIAAHGWLDGHKQDSALPMAGPNDRIMALISADRMLVRWADMGDLPAPQAEAAASLKIAGESLDKADGLHVVAAHNPDGQVLVCSLSKADLQYGLDRLGEYGLDPDIILPAALAVTPAEAAVVRVDLGDGAPILRGEKLAVVDEPSLRAALAGQAEIAEIGDDAMKDQLRKAFANPPINLRRAAFSKRRSGRRISPQQWRILGMMLLGGLLLSLMLGLATYWQYHRAAAREDARMLAAVRKIAPQAASAEAAEAALNRALGQKGQAVRSFTALASALFAELQNERETALRDMRYNRDGTLAINLAAPTADPINRVLLALQAQGYKVTATSRQDTSGLTIAEITMRVP